MKACFYIFEWKYGENAVCTKNSLLKSKLLHAAIKVVFFKNGDGWREHGKSLA